VHDAGFDPSRERESALVVAGDEPGAEAVPGRVRDRHRLVGVRDRLRDEHRAERLLGVDARARRHVGEDRRPVALGELSLAHDSYLAMFSEVFAGHRA
jgi:hypothetical protein